MTDNGSRPDTAEQVVAAGAAWLDEVYPEWPSKVDLIEFDIEDAYECILGQLFHLEYTWPNIGRSGFGAINDIAERAFGGDWPAAEVDTWMDDHGFVAINHAPAELEDAWGGEVLRRRPEIQDLLDQQ